MHNQLTGNEAVQLVLLLLDTVFRRFCSRNHTIPITSGQIVPLTRLDYVLDVLDVLDVPETVS